MKKIKLLEKKLKSKKIFKGRAVGFNVDTILLPNGKTATREYLTHPGAVAILPILKNGDIVFVKQYRYPIGKATYEIPAGKLHNKKDNFLKRGIAELKEETGYSAKKLAHLVDFWPTPAFSNELLKIYFATDLKAGKAMPDEDEFLKIEFIPLNKAMKMIKTGKIKDSKTIIAIQAYMLNRKQ
ncbi:MAG: NUDIX hydrolase [Elusimicrobiota bacterium]|nr:NUDIX hydrolase [Elusimicrobiota bacterium]